MKSAEAFVKAIERGLSPIKALHSLPDHDPLYIDRIPVEIYRAALRYGWRFLPVWSGKQLAAKHGHFFEATANLLQLRDWARERPTGWILVTGRVSGVFALEVDGIEGLTSLLLICRDDWSWLDTRRAVAGETRHIFFASPNGRRQISSRRQIAKGLRVLGEGDWLLVPPSREPHGAQHAYMNPNTRDRKEIHTSSEVIAAHRQIAAEFGNQADHVVASARERAEGLTQNRVPDAPQKAQEAVSFAKERSFEREAVTDERNIMRDALRRGMGDLTYDQVRTNFDQRHGSREFQTVNGQKHETGRQFTTRETIAAELATVGHMQRGQNTVDPVLPKEQAAAHANRRELLNPAQRKAIEEVLSTHDRVHGLQGIAGSGKTSTLSSIREGAEQNGYAVEGFAPTSRATAQLREAGISADTLQGFLARGGQEHAKGDPDRRHLYMVDESSLTSTRQMQSFMEKIGSQDRVLLVGDTRQHQGVDAGKPFEQMQQAGMQTSQLDQIMRQKDPGLLRVVEHFAKNETATGVGLLQQQGRVTEIPDNAQRIEAIAKDYASKPENTLVVSPDNASRRDINDAIRTELKGSGVVSKDDYRIRILAPMTGVRRKKDDEAAKDVRTQNESVLVGFRSVYVFDVSQTEGLELPELSSRVRGDVGVRRERLLDFIAGQGILLEFKESIAPALGMSYGGKIALLPGQTPAEEFSTLVHEVAHEMLHKAERRTATSKVVRETEAEAIAFVVGRTIGLDTGRASADYVVFAVM